MDGELGRMDGWRTWTNGWMKNYGAKEDGWNDACVRACVEIFFRACKLEEWMEAWKACRGGWNGKKLSLKESAH